MFDLSFGKLILIGAVALIVIGPERLPMVARTIGTLLGRMKRYVAGVKADIAREMEVEHLRELEAKMNEEGRRLGEELAKAGEPISSNLGQAIDEARAHLEPAGDGVAAETFAVESLNIDAIHIELPRPERDRR